MDNGRNWTRRSFTTQVGWASLGLLGLTTARPLRAVPPALPVSGALPISPLEQSPFVYISPLKNDGRESQCHGEVWFAWIEGAVVATVASDRWKAQAVDRGLDRARIWVGDHGRWKNWYGGTNEAFRVAPSFDAKAEKVRDPALLNQLLEHYEKKYPDEIDQWRETMRKGNADGSRILIRYVPIER